MKQKREFNFARRWELEQAKQTTPSSALPLDLIGWGIGGTVIVLAILGSPWIWAYKLDYDLQNSNLKFAELRPVELQIQKIASLNSQIQKSKQFFELIKKENRDPIEVLYKLKELMPLGTVVTSFSYAGDAISIAVNIPVPVDVARLWVSLRDSGIFQEVDIQSVSLVDQVQKLTLAFKYNPQAQVKYPVSSDQSDKEDQSNKEDQSTVEKTNPEDPEPELKPSIDPAIADGQNLAIRYPDIPKGLVTVPVSSSRVNLSWKPARYASSYNVYRSLYMKYGYIKIANVKETNYTDSELKPGTAYFYKISSVKETGVEGYFDNPVGTVTFDLATPSGFVAKTSSGQIELSWNSVNQAIAYKIYRSSEGGSYNLIVTVPDTKYSDKDLPTGNYSYRINAIAENKTGGTAGPISVKLTN